MNLKNLIPGYAFSNFKNSKNTDGKINHLKSFTRLVGTSIYSFGVTGTLLAYGILIHFTGEFNPSKQLVRRREILEAKAAEKREYTKCWNQLFAPNGLADRNSNGVIDLNEQVDAWGRMGIINTNQSFLANPISDGIRFYNPTLSGLKKAIDSYQVNDQK